MVEEGALGDPRVREDVVDGRPREALRHDQPLGGLENAVAGGFATLGHRSSLQTYWLVR